MLDQMDKKVEAYLMKNRSSAHEDESLTEESQLLINC